MTDHPSDSGYELVLDNGRLIVTFAVLVFFLGCSFVVGFMEGKRQGFQAGAQSAGESAAKPSPNESPAPETHSAGTDTGAKSAKGKPEERPLDWYKSVSGQGEKPAITPPPAVSTPVIKEALPTEPARREAAPITAVAKPSAQPVLKASAKAAPSAPAGFSVQVGAFRQRDQVDTKAQLLRSKGFDCRIEPPDSPEGLFLLKVGKFKSRADAIAMQLRLKNSGFSAFIKSN